MDNILIPDPLVRSALAAARSLGRKGYHIANAIPNQGQSVSLFFNLSRSKYCRKYYRVTSPFKSVAGYQRDLLKIAATRQYDAVLPFNNISAISISLVKKQLSSYMRVPVPEYETIENVHDKANAFRLAGIRNIPAPKTLSPKSKEELLQGLNELTYPVVIKARKNSGPQGLRFAKTKDEAMRYFDEVHHIQPVSPLDDYSFPIVQEFIPGDIYDVFLIYDNGAFLASLAQKRVRTYPVYGGVTAAGKVIRNRVLEETARQLMDNLGWHGCCDVEFKLDFRDQKFKLLEVNSRFPGALDVAIQAGMDFAEIAVNLGTSRELKQDYKLRDGLTYRFISSNEIYNLFQRLTVKRLLEFLNIFKRNVAYDLSFRDIGPNIYGLLSIFKEFIFNRKKILGNKGEDFNRLFFNQNKERM